MIIFTTGISLYAWGYECDGTENALQVAVKCVQFVLSKQLYELKHYLDKNSTTDASLNEVKRMIQVVPSNPPKVVHLVRQHCYTQEPGFERFLFLVCYLDGGLALDVTLVNGQGAWRVRAIKLCFNKKIDQACAKDK
ncbi:hypothetical protein [Thermosulfidibacter takaii]|nr:hypothetical protein [Thermosulfidibacter takaii]